MISKAFTGAAANLAATMAYSSTDPPETLAIIGNSGYFCRTAGIFSLATASTPGPANPTAFSTPSSSTAIRGSGFPTRGRGVAVLITIAPNLLRSTCWAKGVSPKPNVPLAGISGFFSASPGSLTANRLVVSINPSPHFIVRPLQTTGSQAPLGGRPPCSATLPAEYYARSPFAGLRTRRRQRPGHHPSC